MTHHLTRRAKRSWRPPERSAAENRVRSERLLLLLLTILALVALLFAH